MKYKKKRQKYKQRHKTSEKPAKKYVPKVKKEPKSKVLFVFITVLFLLSIFLAYQFRSPHNQAELVFYRSGLISCATNILAYLVYFKVGNSDVITVYLGVAFMVLGFGLPIITFFHPAAVLAMLFGLAGLYWIVEAFLKLLGLQNHPYRKQFDNMIANFGMRWLYNDPNKQSVADNILLGAVNTPIFIATSIVVLVMIVQGKMPLSGYIGAAITLVAMFMSGPLLLIHSIITWKTIKQMESCDIQVSDLSENTMEENATVISKESEE